MGTWADAGADAGAGHLTNICPSLSPERQLEHPCTAKCQCEEVSSNDGPGKCRLCVMYQSNLACELTYQYVSIYKHVK